MLIAERSVAEAHGLAYRAVIRHFAVAAEDPWLVLSAPVPATRKLLERSGMIVEDKAPLSWRVALLRLAARIAEDYRVAQACAQLHLTLNRDPTYFPLFGALRGPKVTTKTPAQPDPKPSPADQPPSA